MTIKQFVFNAFSENTYIAYDHSGECVIIDPGCYDDNEERELKNFIRVNGLTVKGLINTHCHVDHVLGNSFIKNEFGVKLMIHKEDVPTLKANEVVAPIYGYPGYKPCEADVFVKDGEMIRCGDSALEVLHVPGHSPGHIALISREHKICISGDVLFHQSIGRTDLPGGNHDVLIESIYNKLFTLDDDVKVHCGHGPDTTIGYEKKYNPFCGSMIKR